MIVSELIVTPTHLLLTSSDMRGHTNEITHVGCNENHVFDVIINTCVMQTYLSSYNSDDCIDCQLLNRTDYTFVDSITVQSHKDNMTHSILHDVRNRWYCANLQLQQCYQWLHTILMIPRLSIWNTHRWFLV